MLYSRGLRIKRAIGALVCPDWPYSSFFIENICFLGFRFILINIKSDLLLVTIDL